MEGIEIERALADLPGLEITWSQGLLQVRIPAIQDEVRLAPEAVLQLKPIFGPRGERALEIVLLDGDEVRPLIVTADDAVFEPAAESSVLDSQIAVTVSNMPHLVAYSEMERDSRALAVHCQESAELNLASIGGTMLLLRCMIAGAMKLGMRPATSAAYWHSVWTEFGEDLMLPPFRADPLWDELLEDARSIPLTGAPSPAPARFDSASLTQSDFSVPRVSFGRIDEELVEAWRQWIRVSPEVFAECLLDGLPGAEASVAIYPDGGGEASLRVYADETPVGLLQLGFSFPNDDFTLDEIRITGAGKGTGLFQRLLFNTERVGELLGFGQLRVHATGIGSYALAALGYPRDPGLRRRTDRRQ
ncbi:hypothetical protein GCM10009555_011590 [Acrocarpospora macrocephala]|uniref:Uncharacterized protein n=1 Tax=Acrocarpospora macrocephala TaxID=150177 RepID=A0A5M3WPL9_9ACTN|nr:hypothetical protein [Acrocarpospora macrocephala]GES11277.1 hypothetical protein Amac_048740 [Acrocarpospora macrocephala]